MDKNKNKNKNKNNLFMINNRKIDKGELPSIIPNKLMRNGTNDNKPKKGPSMNGNSKNLPNINIQKQNISKHKYYTSFNNLRLNNQKLRESSFKQKDPKLRINNLQRKNPKLITRSKTVKSKFTSYTSGIKNYEDENKNFWLKICKNDFNKYFEKFSNEFHKQPQYSKWCVLTCILNAAIVLNEADDTKTLDNFKKIISLVNEKELAKSKFFGEEADTNFEFDTDDKKIKIMLEEIGLKETEYFNDPESISEAIKSSNNNKCFMFTVKNNNSDSSHQILGYNGKFINPSGTKSGKFINNKIYEDKGGERQRKVTDWWSIDNK